jgi:hypothetical protein
MANTPELGRRAKKILQAVVSERSQSDHALETAPLETVRSETVRSEPVPGAGRLDGPVLGILPGES